MTTKNILALVTSGIVLFVLGGVCVMAYQWQTKNNGGILSQLQQQKVPDVIKVLSSNVVPAMAARGIVTKVDGKNITLTSQGDSITVTMRDDAKLYTFVLNTNITKPVKGSTPANTSTSREISIKDVNIGDDLNVNIKVFPSGQIEGISGVVLPPFLNPSGK